MTMTKHSVGVGVIGMGWMGQAHSRSFMRLPSLFPDRVYQPRLVLCADNVEARRDESGPSCGCCGVCRSCAAA